MRSSSFFCCHLDADNKCCNQESPYRNNMCTKHPMTYEQVTNNLNFIMDHARTLAKTKSDETIAASEAPDKYTRFFSLYDTLLDWPIYLVKNTVLCDKLINSIPFMEAKIAEYNIADLPDCNPDSYLTRINHIRGDDTVSEQYNDDTVSYNIYENEEPDVFDEL